MGKNSSIALKTVYPSSPCTSTRTARRAASIIISRRRQGASDEENVPVQPVEGGGYGRVFTIADITAKELANTLRQTLGAERLWVFGGEQKIGRAASFCGAGVDGDTIKIAKERGAQALISADIKHNYICEALDLGMNVIELTHYASENYGFHKIYQNLKDKLGVASEYCDDGFML